MIAFGRPQALGSVKVIHWIKTRQNESAQLQRSTLNRIRTLAHSQPFAVNCPTLAHINTMDTIESDDEKMRDLPTIYSTRLSNNPSPQQTNLSPSPKFRKKHERNISKRILAVKGYVEPTCDRWWQLWAAESMRNARQPFVYIKPTVEEFVLDLFNFLGGKEGQADDR